MMKKLSIATVALVMMAGSALADPVEGTWKTKVDDNGNYGHVLITKCGAMFCGKLVKAFDGAGNEIVTPNIGRKIVWDMVPYPDGLYDDGTIYSPDREATYDSDMTLSGNTLKVRGCMIGICRDGGTWQRVN